MAQPQAYGQAPAYGQPGYAPPATNGLSIASMILGIVGILGSLIWIGLLPAVAAVITGHMAVKRQPSAKPFWLTGLITGYIGIAITVIYILVLILHHRDLPVGELTIRPARR